MGRWRFLPSHSGIQGLTCVKLGCSSILSGLLLLYELVSVHIPSRNTNGSVYSKGMLQLPNSNICVSVGVKIILRSRGRLFLCLGISLVFERD